jgi:hypothetical protein
VAGFAKTVRVLSKLWPACQVLSYFDQFERLWSMLPKLAGTEVWPDELVGPMVLIWDGVPTAPDGAEDIVGYKTSLTAFDWIVAMTAAVQSILVAQPNRQPPALHLIVVDCVESQRWDSAFSVSLATAVDSLLPWVTICKPAGRGRSMAQCISGGLAAPAPDRDAWKSAARVTTQVWRSELTRAGRRHSVSNVIGPIALAQSLVDEGFSAAELCIEKWFGDRSDLRRHFWTLLWAIGLVRMPVRLSKVGAVAPDGGPITKRNGSHKMEVGEIFRRVSETGDVFGRFKHLRFALIDDQAPTGFHDVLSVVLFGSSAIQAKLKHTSKKGSIPIARSTSNSGQYSLDSYITPDLAVEWLEREAADKSRVLPSGLVGQMRSRLLDAPPIVPPDNVLPEFDILFLDLRLYQDDTVVDLPWVPRLRKLLAKNSDRWTANLSADKRSAVQKLQKGLSLAQKARVDPRSALAGETHWELALLPIALSLADPSLPIVLFSSTRQRPVMELLQPFLNIGTHFSKPAITGYTGDRDVGAGTPLRDLKAAIRDALVLHETRFLWDMMSRFDVSRARVPPVFVGTGDKFRPSEILDEQALEPPKSYEKQFLDLFISNFLAGRIREAIFRPYEIVETVLKKNHPAPAGSYHNYRFSDFAIHTDPQTHQSVRTELNVGMDPTRKARQRIALVNNIQHARHNYAHGKLLDLMNNEDQGTTRQVAAVLFIQLMISLDCNLLQELTSWLLRTPELVALRWMLTGGAKPDRSPLLDIYNRVCGR